MAMAKMCPFLFSSVDARALPSFCSREIVEKKCKCLKELCAWWNEDTSSCAICISSIYASQQVIHMRKMTEKEISELKSKL